MNSAHAFDVTQRFRVERATKKVEWKLALTGLYTPSLNLTIWSVWRLNLNFTLS